MTDRNLTYTIDISSVGEDLWKADVQVFDDADVIIEGSTLVGCETEEQAYEYTDLIYMVDLRRNNPKTLGDLILVWEIPEEPEEEEPDDDPEGDPVD